MQDSAFAPGTDSPFETGGGPFHPLNAHSLARGAYLQIKRMILSGIFHAGERISEEKVATILHVSRTPIREALRLLEQYGLVVLKPRSYAKVAEITESEAREVATVRAVLEKQVFREILSHGWMDAGRLSSLTREALEKLAGGGRAEVYLLDSAFHLELARQCGNSTLFSILERLDAKIQLVRLWADLSVEQYRANLTMHLELIEHIKNGDLDSVSALLDRHIITPDYRSSQP